ncbi:hypothetical protein [Natronolimnohabitans innermongolicus]|uniref:Methylated-DNA--protein-cysteine methyltransferase n=1 Tax=Natronolimnohabitans innermongolicus JCM 12255 TaxID=1227499 RepID=L9X1N9_9EURY|nr:hypothetical protein [Natronolimnohabitans innermongolicus]ELY54488.1 methylated-DNA--protein-cysteine methyltransferase [Natronolimnohabitans innermongolicus JCM 12255]
MQIRIFGHDVGVDDSRIDASPETIREQVREYEAGERSPLDLEIG